MKRLLLVWTMFFSFVLVSSVSAIEMTYSILDIGNFSNFDNSNVSDTYTGTGFVGMRPEAFTHVFGFQGSSPDVQTRVALQVDISDLADSIINSAYLSFIFWEGSGFEEDMTVTSFSADGSLGFFWDSPDNLNSTDYSIFRAPGDITLDVTTLLRSRVEDDADWLGLHLQQDATASMFTYTYPPYGGSPDEAMVRLRVDYSKVPEPATIFILFTGLIGLVGFRRKFKKD